jgi:WD40 repeat protein
VRLWDATDGTLLYTLEGHTDDVSSVVFSADGSTLISGAWDDTVRLWDVRDGTLLHMLEDTSGSVYDVALSPDGTRLATALHDGVWLWRTPTE